jgi:multiple sugar transport system permease protein
MTTDTLPRLHTEPAAEPAGPKKPRPWGQIASQVFLICASILWLLPIAFALYVAVRPYSDTTSRSRTSVTRGPSRTWVTSSGTRC